MKRLGKLTRGKLIPGRLTLTVLAVALAAPALAGAVPVINSFGSVAHVEHVASYVSPQDLKDFDSGNTRAGSVVGKAPPHSERLDRNTGVTTT